MSIINEFILDEKKKDEKWHSLFIDYFKKHVFPDINNIARYSVEKIAGKYFNQFTGVTTNHGEGLNNLWKQVTSRVAQPVDVLCLAMRQISVYYHNEIMLGMDNKGKKILIKYKKNKYINKNNDI